MPISPPPSLTFLLGLSSSHSCWPGYSLCLLLCRGSLWERLYYCLKYLQLLPWGRLYQYVPHWCQAWLWLVRFHPMEGFDIFALLNSEVTMWLVWPMTCDIPRWKLKRSIISFPSATRLAISQIKDAPSGWVPLWRWQGAELHDGHIGWKERNLYCKPWRVRCCLLLQHSLSWQVTLLIPRSSCFGFTTSFW